MRGFSDTFSVACLHFPSDIYETVVQVLKEVACGSHSGTSLGMSYSSWYQVWSGPRELFFYSLNAILLSVSDAFPTTETLSKDWQGEELPNSKVLSRWESRDSRGRHCANTILGGGPPLSRQGH